MASSIGFLRLERLGHVLLTSLVFLSLAAFQSSQLQQSLDANGNTYLGTPVLAQPTMPTMYYNCALMPAICNNVQQWLTDNNHVLPRDFHVQTENTKNARSRGDDSCPGDWATTHTCPELIGQPAIVHGYGQNINGNPLYTMVQFGNGLLLNNFVSVPPSYAPFTNEIQGIGQGESSGLAYTCDEFPPKT